MPIVYTLRLQPSRPWRPDTKQLHGLASALFDPPGAKHNGQDKPFATWPVTRDPADPHVGLLLRCAWLRDDPPPHDLAATLTLRLGSATCALVHVDPRWASHATLAAGAPATTATLTFQSPTYFSHNDEDLVDPDPGRIVGSWRRQWNQTLPPDSALRIDDAVWRPLRHAVRLVAPYELRTAEMDSGHGPPRPGFVGVATLRLALSAPLPVRSAFATLVRFASYCGTGAQTTHGFGATTSATGTPAGATPTAAHG